MFRVLRPGGRFALILRHHPPGRAPAWLPNPISRGGDEVVGARAALAAVGFALDERADRLPYALLAHKPRRDGSGATPKERVCARHPVRHQPRARGGNGRSSEVTAER